MQEAGEDDKVSTPHTAIQKPFVSTWHNHPLAVGWGKIL